MKLADQTQPLVSVGLLTYNHEKYIAKAIDSVLMQKVNFKYEIVVAEDCSTDNTRNIILEYQKKYPDIIRLLLQEKNVGVQDNSRDLRRACKGKYRANLEGDDYWASDQKLQFQVDFLENNPDYIAIGGDFICINDEGKRCKFPWGDIRYTYCQDEEYTVDHLKRWLLFGHTSTMLYRNFFSTCGEEANIRFDNVQLLGDRRVSLALVLQGRVRHEKKVWVVRRVLAKSKSSMTNAVKNSNYIGANYGWLCEAERFAKSEYGYNLDLSEIKEKRWIGSWKFFVRNPNKENIKIILYVFSKSNKKIKYIYLFFNKAAKKIRNIYINRGMRGCFESGMKLFRKIKINFSNNEKQENSNPMLYSFSKKSR